MPVFREPRDPPPFGLSFELVVIDEPAYLTNSFDAYVETSRDYATWFAKSSAGPIIRKWR